MPIAARRLVTHDQGRVSVLGQVVWCFLPREASVIWWAIHSAVGLAVTLSDINRRRSCAENNQNEEQPEADRGHDEEIHGGNAAAWLWKKVFQVCDRLAHSSPCIGDRRLCDLNPSFSSSPWMRALPRAGWPGSSLGSSDGSPLEPLADRHESATSSASTAGNLSDATG